MGEVRGRRAYRRPAAARTAHQLGRQDDVVLGGLGHTGAAFAADVARRPGRDTGHGDNASASAASLVSPQGTRRDTTLMSSLGLALTPQAAPYGRYPNSATAWTTRSLVASTVLQ